jgi:DNA polymerase III subunit delta'
MPLRDVIGHRQIIALLARSIAHDSLPPSLIFAGPSGIGKRLTAVAVAQTLNCTNRQSPADLDVDACGVCASCVRIARSTHPDVLLIEQNEKGNIQVDQVREAIDRAAYRPFEGRSRLVIIDEADALMPQAQNALLKTLEEPRSASVFILVSAHADVLLPTVRSRCPRLPFRPLPAEDIAAALVARGQTRAEAEVIAATADGSLGSALAASAGALAAARKIAQHVLTRSATMTEPGRRIEVAKDLLAKTGAGGAGEREQLSAHLRAMASLLRDIELLSTRADARALANRDLQPEMQKLTESYRGERGMRAFTAVDRALGALERYAGVKVVADWVVLQL